MNKRVGIELGEIHHHKEVEEVPLSAGVFIKKVIQVLSVQIFKVIKTTYHCVEFVAERDVRKDIVLGTISTQPMIGESQR